MPEIKHLFNAGRMNKDLDERLIPNGEYKDALNIQLASTDSGNAGAIQNLLGNSVINPGILFEDPLLVGSVADESSETIYWLIQDIPASYLLSYSNDTVNVLIKDVGNSVFKFTGALITGINYFEGYLAFTDNVNEPKLIDLRLYEEGDYKVSSETGVDGNTQINGVDLQEKDITVIKEKPKNALSITLNPVTVENPTPLFENKFIRFSYRWKFKNGQYSVFAPFTITAFQPADEINYDLEEGFNVQMLNNTSSIGLSGFEKISDVEYIDILYTESNSPTIYVYKTIKASAITDATSEIQISKESIYSVIPENQTFRHYDNVPKKALAQEIVGNRIVYANYTDGLNLEDYDPEFTVAIQNRLENTFRSIKSGRNYQLGILFEDEYGRQTPVVSNDTGSFFRDYDGLGVGKEITVSTSAPPIDSSAARFKYYIKSTEQEYYNIIIDEAYNDTDNPDDFLWLVIPSYEINKVQEEDFIILKKGANSVTPLNNPNLKYKVLDIKSAKPNNISSTKSFEDKFFLKLKKDAFLTEELFAQQGLAGSSGIIEDTPNNDNWSITTNGMGSNPLMLMWYELYGNRETYYYQDGKIYTDTTQADEQSQDTFPENLQTLSTGASCVSGSGEDWIQIKTDISFTDSLGNVVTDIYVRLIEGGATVPAPEAFAICYENASTEDVTPSPAVFETIPKNDILDIYYETEDSYPIHEITQTKTLQWFNCFDLTNGVESNRIRDDFNEVVIDKQVRVSTTLAEQYKEKINSTGLIWSGIFNSRNSINRLNQFLTAEAITKDINPEYGSIQKLHTRDTDLIVFCENKVLRVLANKDALYNANGSVNLTASNNVLGQSMPYAGEFGISKNPESFCSYGYQAYFTDKARGAVLRLSKDGLTVISEVNMARFFNSKFTSHVGYIIGSYDIHTKQYILSFDRDESLAFNELVKGWTSRLSFIPDGGLYLNGIYYTFNSGTLWKHHFGNVNNFYGKQYVSSVNFMFNSEPSAIKNFKTIGFEGTQGNIIKLNETTNEVERSVTGWKASSIVTDQQLGKVTNFKGKDGKWYNNIYGIEKGVVDLDAQEFPVQGIGRIINFTPGDQVIVPPPDPDPDPDPIPEKRPPSSAKKIYYYKLSKCSDNTTNWRTDKLISTNELEYNDRVQDDLNNVYIVVGSTESYTTSVGNVINLNAQGCPVLAQVNTLDVVDFGANALTFIGDITYVGDPNYTEKGFVWIEGNNVPDLSNNVEIVSGTLAGEYSKIVTSLNPETIYSYRAYATNLAGTAYGELKTATTLQLSYWSLRRCSDTATGFISEQDTETLTGLFPGDRVLDSSSNEYTVIGTAFTGTSVGNITTTGAIGCTPPPDPTFDCSAASFNVSDGTVGNAVSATSSGTIVSISPSTYQLGTTTYVGTITAPAGYSNVGSNISCSDSATGSNGGDPDPTFDCNTASFTVYDGQIGDSVNAVSSGTIVSISPSTYQTGNVTYTGTITAPAGYTNTGSNISCTDTAFGSDTPVPDPEFTCTDANFSVSDGNVGDSVQGTASGTIVSITPSTYQSGTTTYTGVITIPNGFQNAGSTISCTASATGTELPVTFEYQLESCADGLTTYKSDPTTAVFSVGERVTVGASVFVVLGTNPPAGATSVGWIVYTGFTGCPVVADPTYTCNDANFSVSDGVVGDTVQATSSSSIVSISPSTYQAGAITYTGVITIPAGYDNAGGTINCTDSALGTSAPTCHAVTYDESLYGLDKDVYGIAYNDYQGNLQKVAFNSMLSSVSGTQYTYYVCAANVGNDVWDVVSNVAVPQYNDSLSVVGSGTPCEGFCEPPGGGGL